jgi:hypothetical protein
MINDLSSSMISQILSVLGASSMHRSLQCTKAAGVGSLPAPVIFGTAKSGHFEVSFLCHLVMSYNSPTPYHLQFNIYILLIYNIKCMHIISNLGGTVVHFFRLQDQRACCNCHLQLGRRTSAHPPHSAHLPAVP